MKNSINNNNAGILIFLSVFFVLIQSTFAESKDSIVYSIPNEFHGTLLYDSTNSIEKSDIQRINYSTIYDILNTRNELFGMSLGINGHNNSFISYGAIENNLELGFNGRILTNFYNGKFTLDNFSPEFFERIEILNGSDASILSSRPNNSYLNIQEIIYNTKIPFTRLWYAQEGGSFISADGIFSQNFSDGWNFTFGFKKMDDNLAFENMSTDYWNLRFIIRYNIDSTSSVSISDNFTNSKIRTNGGSDPINSFDVYSPINSSPYFSSIELRNLRHDVNVTYSNKMDFFNITNTTYFTNDVNERALPNFGEFDTLGNTSNTEMQFGNRANLDFSFDNIDFKVGSNITSFNSGGTNFFREYSGLNWNIYSRAELEFTEKIKISGGINYGHDSKNSFLGFGEKIIYNLNSLSYLFIDHSFTSNNGLIHSNNLENENVNLFIAGINLESFKLEGFYRIVNSAIHNRLVNEYYTEQYNVGDYQAIGGSASFNDLILSGIFDENDKINLNIQTRMNLITGNEELENFYPLFTINCGLNYLLMVNKSELNLGFKAGLLDSKTAPRYIPITNSFVTTDSNVGIQTTGLNIYSIMKLGNAFVKIEWENLLDANYFNVAYYPERGQIVKLSVAWSFFD